ncbi:hypothetical protein CSHISOI_10592 [Colletotrichum shisoi]|uniref:Uncharacterized protein n=1 Tax=Colletotrichum shisoi TaxID=2078593 RepID=A0A5Q4BCV2_9PEZI|nr:hypothetical protein CSHISOI_10592 [Colletotrichum shisoi]
MVSPMSSLKRRAIRRPHFPRDDLEIEIRDDLGETSSDDDNSPSPSGSTFPPVVLNPADPTESISSSSTSSDFPRPTAPPRGPQRGPSPGFDTSVTSKSSSSSSTSSFPTAFPQSTTGSDSQPSGGGADRGGNEEGLGNDRSIETGWTPTAIAFGTIAIAALFLVLGVGTWWCVRYQKRRKARNMYDRNVSPDGSFWDPPATFSPPSAAAAAAAVAPVRRSPSSFMAELMSHAYAAEDGHAAAGAYPGAYASDNDADRNSLAPQGYLDEKRHDPARQLPILEPAPVAQPNVRNSFASWIRRHHPLKLNPMPGRNSVYSTRSLAASSRSVNNAPLPPVPALPDSTGYNTNSLLSLYHTQPQHPYQHPYQQQLGQPPWLMDPPPVVFGERGVSMAPTEATARTESTWRSWGGGVTQPQHHHQHQQSPPGTPRRGWIEKCINFGGLK